MRKLFLTLWLLIPLGVVAYHYGPGQDHGKLDQADVSLATAREALEEYDAPKAMEAYEEVILHRAEDDIDGIRRVRLAQANIAMENHGLPQARQELASLHADLVADENADPELVRETQTALASARYYVTWLLRLEGHAPEIWEPEIDGARQLYRQLAEETEGTPEAQKHREDLESAIRLARMDLTELQGLPLPSQ